MTYRGERVSSVFFEAVAFGKSFMTSLLSDVETSFDNLYC